MLLQKIGLGRTLSLWFLTRTAVVALLIFSVEHANFADVYKQYLWAHGAWHAHVLPGRDFPWEYPPGASVFLLLPGTDGGAAWYFVEFLAETLAIDAAVTLLLHRLSLARGSATGLWIWLLLVPVLGPVIVTRFDVVPAALVATALAVAGGAPVAAAALLTFGVTVKVWPVLILVLLLATTAKRTPAMVATALAGAVALAAFAATGVLPAASSTVTNQLHRGSQVESLPALPFLWLHALGGPAKVTYRHSAWEVTARGTDVVALLFSLFGACTLVVVFVLTWRASRTPGFSSLALASATVVCIAVIGNKVFSPQYLLWLLAPLAIAGCRPGVVTRPMIWMVGVAVGLTHAVYPLSYVQLLGGQVVPLLLLTARDAALCLLAWLLMRALVSAASTKPVPSVSSVLPVPAGAGS